MLSVRAARLNDAFSMNPYQAPTVIEIESRSSALRLTLALFCFGWAFGTAFRGRLDEFSWIGVAALLLAIYLWRSDLRSH